MKAAKNNNGIEKETLSSKYDSKYTSKMHGRKKKHLIQMSGGDINLDVKRILSQWNAQ